MHLLRLLAREGVAPVVRRTIPIAAPAVTAGWTFTPDNGRAWQVMSVYVSLVTDSNAADRTITLTLSDGSHTLWAVPAAYNQAASTTTANSWIAEWPAFGVTTYVVTGVQVLPTVILLPGWTLTLSIANAQAGDQLGATSVQVLEAFVGRTEHEYDKARALADRLLAIAEYSTDEVPGL